MTRDSIRTSKATQMEIQMNTNKTAEIFYLAAAETLVDSRHGLSQGVTNSLAGCAGQHAKDEDGFVKEVLNQADNFTTSIESLIETVEGGDGESKEADMKGLKEMMGWIFDTKELEKMAREDWVEYHVAYEE